MSNVIKFPEIHESCSYTDTDGVLGVINNTAEIELFFNQGKPLISLHCDNVVEFKDRKELAEFLWMCVRLVDPEGRWEKSEYVGMNYE